MGGRATAQLLFSPIAFEPAYQGFGRGLGGGREWRFHGPYAISQPVEGKAARASGLGLRCSRSPGRGPDF